MFLIFYCNMFECIWYQLVFVLIELEDFLYCKCWCYGMVECNGFVYIMGGFYDEIKQVFSYVLCLLLRYENK